MNNILIELILTNQCNKRCEYCDLDFRNKSLSYSDLDLFIDFLSKNKANYTINFFWWEPLLEFEKLKYFLEKSKKYVNRFTIWTNWFFLDREKLYFFKKNNVKIYLSIDNITLWKDLNLDLIKNYNEIININFINDPDYLNNSIYLYEKIISFWFKNISFMPVYTTKKRNKDNLIKLKIVYDNILSNSLVVNLNYFCYYNWFSSDKQFILDTDWFFYSDLDSLLWLQKQYSIIDKNIIDYIENSTKLISLYDNNLSLEKIISFYNKEKILRMVLNIPKSTWNIISFKIIDKILKYNYV